MKQYIILFLFVFLTFNTNAQLGFCSGNAESPIFLEDFGTGLDYGPQLPAGTTNYIFVGTSEPVDGEYTVGSSSSSFGWDLIEDHTPGDTNGKCLIVNASFTAGEFYITTVTGLCENTTYEFSSWLINVLPDVNGCGDAIPVNVQFEIWDNTDTNLLASGDTGDILSMAIPTWEQYGLGFQTLPGQTSVILKMINNGVGGCGNDLAIDDIAFSTCGDFISVTDASNNTQLEICENEVPVSLELTATPDFSVYTSHFYQWQESVDGTAWTDLPGETNQILNVSVSGTMFYRSKVAEDAVNLGNSQCVSLSDVFQISFNLSPDAPVSDGDMAIDCDEVEVILSATVPSGISVNWYDAAVDGTLLEANTMTYLATAEGTYYAEAFDTTTGCISLNRTEINAITVFPDPPVSNGDVAFNCALNEAVLSVTVPAGVSVNWYDASVDGNLLAFNDASYTADTQGIYFAEAIDEETGCISLTRVAIEVSLTLDSSNCIIPQGISPDGSPGQNDEFDLSNFDVQRLKIFNRYGTLVYSKANYTNEWTGQSNDGKDLPVGTYFYTMEYENGKARSAWVYIQRLN